MVLQIWKEKPGKRQHIDEISTCVQSWWIARECGFPLLAYSFKYWSGSLLGSVSVSSDLRSHLWLPVFFSQWKIKGLVPTNTHFPLGQLAGKHEHHCLPAVHSCPGAVPSARRRRMLLLAWHSSWSGWRTGREPFWHTFRKIFFLVFSSLLSFDLSLAHSSTQGMLFNFLYVPFLQAYLNLRNWVFLTTSKSGLMTVKSSTAVVLQVQDVLSQGLSGNNKSIYGRDMLQVTCTVNKCACCSQNWLLFIVLRMILWIEMLSYLKGGWGEKKMFPEDKKCNSLFYFPLSTSIMKSYPPGTASNMLNSTSNTSAAQSIPRRQGCDTKHCDTPGGSEPRGGRGKAKPVPSPGPSQLPPIEVLLPRSCPEAPTKANGGKEPLLRYPYK